MRQDTVLANEQSETANTCFCVQRFYSIDQTHVVLKQKCMWPTVHKVLAAKLTPNIPCTCQPRTDTNNNSSEKVSQSNSRSKSGHLPSAIQPIMFTIALVSALRFNGAILCPTLRWIPCVGARCLATHRGPMIHVHSNLDDGFWRSLLCLLLCLNQLVFVNHGAFCLAF